MSPLVPDLYGEITTHSGVLSNSQAISKRCVVSTYYGTYGSFGMVDSTSPNPGRAG